MFFDVHLHCGVQSKQTKHHNFNECSQVMSLVDMEGKVGAITACQCVFGHRRSDLTEMESYLHELYHEMSDLPAI